MFAFYLKPNGQFKFYKTRNIFYKQWKSWNIKNFNFRMYYYLRYVIYYSRYYKGKIFMYDLCVILI